MDKIFHTFSRPYSTQGREFRDAPRDQQESLGAQRTNILKYHQVSDFPSPQGLFTVTKTIDGLIVNIQLTDITTLIQSKHLDYKSKLFQIFKKS